MGEEKSGGPIPTDEVNWREREKLWVLRGEICDLRDFIDYVKEHHPDVANEAASYAIKKAVERSKECPPTTK